MICILLTNMRFWAAFFGLVGTLLIFFFGLPPRIDPERHTHLTAEQENKEEKKKMITLLIIHLLAQV